MTNRVCISLGGGGGDKFVATEEVMTSHKKVCSHTNAHACTHMCTHAHTHVHTHTHTHTHT